ncbi:MAG: DUF1330 domain-containing protein [Sphingobium sp.]
MPAYAIFIREETTNADELKSYFEKVGSTMQGHALTPLAVSSDVEVLEGGPVENIVILQFPTLAEARAWYDSPAYQEVLGHRLAGGKYRGLLVEGR